MKKLKALGFDGPYSGARHQFMNHKNHRLAIPSNNEFSIPQLKFMLREVEIIIEKPITSAEWNTL